jgi:hypothetical protein
LANSFRYPALLRYPYSNRENVADAQVVAINCGTLNVPEATVDAVFAFVIPESNCNSSR